MEISEMITMISTVGFPIFIAVVLLYTREKDNDKLTTIIENNTKTMQQVIDVISRFKDGGTQ